MEHIKSSFYFKDKRGDWQVDYHYQSIVTSWGSTYNELKATVLLNNELYQYFDKIPSTKTENPTKTQAKEIITHAKNLNKEADKREAKINKILK